MRKFSDTIVVVFTWILIFLFVAVAIMLFYVAYSDYIELKEEMESTPEPIEFDFNTDIDGVEYFKDHGPETYVFKTDEYDVEVTIYRSHVTISNNDTGEYVSIDFDQLYLYS